MAEKTEARTEARKRRGTTYLIQHNLAEATENTVGSPDVWQDLGVVEITGRAGRPSRSSPVIAASLRLSGRMRAIREFVEQNPELVADSGEITLRAILLSSPQDLERHTVSVRAMPQIWIGP